MVGVVDSLEELLPKKVVLDLFLRVEVHSVVVSRELVSLEKLDCSLVELDNDNFVKKTETLDIVLCLDDLLGQLRDLVHLTLLRHKVSLKRVFALPHVFYLLNCVFTVRNFLVATLFHLVFLVDSLKNGLQVKDLELEPSAHVGKRVLHLVRQRLHVVAKVLVLGGLKHQVLVVRVRLCVCHYGGPYHYCLGAICIVSVTLNK